MDSAGRGADRPKSHTPLARAGRALYRYRSYTPLPLVALLLWKSAPSERTLWAGIPLITAGEALRLWALRYIGGASRSTGLGAARLVTGGPYGFTRNPLYLGNLVLSLGLAIASGIHFLPPLLLLLFAIQYVPIIAAEEADLRSRFPALYPEYRRHVSRVFSLPAARGGSPPLHGWREAAIIERRTLASVSMLLLFLLARWWRV